MAVLRDEKARETLPRYFEVMEGGLPARFQVCKRIEVEIDMTSSDERLWSAHMQGLKEFRKLLSKVDERKVKLERLARPEPSPLDLKVELALRVLKSCQFCELRCRVDRTAEKKVVCGLGKLSRVASDFKHRGEEPELVPSYTIFFFGCIFKCQFCQNGDISQCPSEGVETSAKSLARLVENARKDGARNVNGVGGDPGPNLHTILEALELCKSNVPSVWNSNMYMSLEAMNLLSGTQDVYLTDFKYGNEKCAIRYSKVPNYFEVVSRNHRLACADAEILIRHLVLPSNIECCTRPILELISKNMGNMIRVNLMNQYRHEARTYEYHEISRRVKPEEFERVLATAHHSGLKNVIT